MRIAVLSTYFSDEASEVEEDLTKTGEVVREALRSFGLDAEFFDVNEKTFETLRKAKVDMAFNVCERFNGNSSMEPHVAAMLELLGIPYTGSSPLALALCMNKVRVKEILKHNNIMTPAFQLFYSKNKKLRQDMNFPLIVKPICMDNSIGITESSIVRDEKELQNRVSSINRAYNQAALAEEYIEGREFAVAVLGNHSNAQALPISEFIFTEYERYPILSYAAKWDPESESYINSPEVCPAELPKYLELKMKKIAVEVHKVLEVRDYGRIDLRLGRDGNIYVLEMNPNPGISSDNTIPKAAKSIGLSYNEMIYEILYRAMLRYNITPSRESKLLHLKKVEELKSSGISSIGCGKPQIIKV